MILSTTRSYAILLLTLSVASVASRAVPVSSTPFSTSSGSTALGLPDRDVVRHPYENLAPILGGFYTPQASSIIGPNLGLGAGFPPSLISGGGGSAGFGGGSSGLFGSGAGSVPSFSAPPAGVPANGNAGSSSQGGSSNSGGSGGSSTIIISSAQTDQATVPSVPDGGASVVLMGTGLLALGALRRRFGRSGA